MSKVYCLPVETSDCDVFTVVDGIGNVVFKGDYYKCCDFIEDYCNKGLVYYFEDVED